jgi:hypothetical protein
VAVAATGAADRRTQAFLQPTRRLAEPMARLVARLCSLSFTSRSTMRLARYGLAAVAAAAAAVQQQAPSCTILRAHFSTQSARGQVDLAPMQAWQALPAELLLFLSIFSQQRVEAPVEMATPIQADQGLVETTQQPATVAMALQAPLVARAAQVVALDWQVRTAAAAQLRSALRPEGPQPTALARRQPLPEVELEARQEFRFKA